MAIEMDMNAFLPPLAGSFLGVSFGILANHYYQKYIANENKVKYKKMIKSEIEQCVGILEQEWVQLLPVDRWTSAVNSGALKLFEVDVELEPLSVAYQSIKEHNQYVIEGEFNGHTWEWIVSPKASLSGKTEKIGGILMNKYFLLRNLKALNKAECLNPSNEATPGYNDDFRYKVNARR